MIKSKKLIITLSDGSKITRADAILRIMSKGRGRLTKYNIMIALTEEYADYATLLSTQNALSPLISQNYIQVCPLLSCEECGQDYHTYKILEAGWLYLKKCKEQTKSVATEPVETLHKEVKHIKGGD